MLNAYLVSNTGCHVANLDLYVRLDLLLTLHNTCHITHCYCTTYPTMYTIHRACAFQQPSLCVPTKGTALCVVPANVDCWISLQLVCPNCRYIVDGVRGDGLSTSQLPTLKGYASNLLV